MRRSRRHPAPPASPPWALLSLVLRYPDERVLAARAAVEEEAARRAGDAVGAALERFLDGWTGDATELAARYVETFDLRRRASLNLTYYGDGDTRERGMSLLRLKALYRSAGLPLAVDELPDHLTIMLAFAALAEPAQGEAILARYRPALELLRLSLHDLESPYAHAIDALSACLPPLSVTERSEVARLAREGPPDEAVGLEPYGPPEAMPTGSRA